MALFRITVKQNKYANGIRLEKGMTVDVSSSYTNPLLNNGAHEVIDAFKRIYNIDISRIGVLSTVYFDVKKLDR